MNIVLNPNFLRSLGLVFASALAIQKTIQFFKVCTNIDANHRHHILDKPEHLFNEKCGLPCVIEVAEKLAKNVEVKDSETKLEANEYCRHGCLIGVRLGLSTKTQEWHIGTAFHIGPCKEI